jgi:Rieske 2Fe-2S family protein
MELRPGAVTMSLTGESDATPLRGLSSEQRRQVLYVGLLPNLLISLHPDYVLTHRMTPLAAGRTEIECQWLFSPEDVSAHGFDPAFAVEFWDITNRQDWHAIESVYRGMGSRAFVPGPLSEREGCVRLFDVLMARAYLSGSSVPPLPEDLAQLVR